MAARSTSGFVCFSDHPRFLLLALLHRAFLPSLLEERGVEGNEGNEDSRRLRSSLFKILDSIFYPRGKCSLKFFLQFDSKVVNSDGKSASNRPFNVGVIRVISRKNRGGMKIRIYFNETSNFF